MMVLKRKEAHVDHKEREREREREGEGERMKWVKSRIELFSAEFRLM